MTGDAQHLLVLTELRVGDPLSVRVRVDLGSLKPDDVVVELVTGSARGEGDLKKVAYQSLEYCGKDEGTIRRFEGTLVPERSGRFGYGIRVRALSPGGSPLHDGSMVLWG